jgi:hypothetical protein
MILYPLSQLQDDDGWLAAMLARIVAEHRARAIAVARSGKVVDLRAYKLAAMTGGGALRCAGSRGGETRRDVERCGATRREALRGVDVEERTLPSHARHRQTNVCPVPNILRWGLIE